MVDNYVLWGCAGSAHAQIRQLANNADWLMESLLLADVATVAHPKVTKQSHRWSHPPVKPKLPLEF